MRGAGSAARPWPDAAALLACRRVWRSEGSIGLVLLFFLRLSRRGTHTNPVSGHIRTVGLRRQQTTTTMQSSLDRFEYCFDRQLQPKQATPHDQSAMSELRPLCYTLAHHLWATSGSTRVAQFQPRLKRATRALCPLSRR